MWRSEEISRESVLALYLFWGEVSPAVSPAMLCTPARLAPELLGKSPISATDLSTTVLGYRMRSHIQLFTWVLRILSSRLWGKSFYPWAISLASTLLFEIGFYWSATIWLDWLAGKPPDPAFSALGLQLYVVIPGVNTMVLEIGTQALLITQQALY